MSINEGDIYVNYGHVDNVEQALNDADNAIQRVLNQLQDVINPLRATWSGVSEDEYIQVQTRWNNDVGDMSNILNKYNATLSEMKINYGNTDNNLALSWASIHA